MPWPLPANTSFPFPSKLIFHPCPGTVTVQVHKRDIHQPGPSHEMDNTHRAQKEGPSELSRTKPEAREGEPLHPAWALPEAAEGLIPPIPDSIPGLQKVRDDNANFCPCRLSVESMPILTSTCPLGRGWSSTISSVFLYLDNCQASYLIL